MRLHSRSITIEATVAHRMPDKHRRAKRSDWADANASGALLDSFLEGPVLDADGNLFVVDIPHGRIFRIDAEGHWECVVEYDGWPNGMALTPDGRMLICDYKLGLLQLEVSTGTIEPLLESRNSERFKGVNDLCISSCGDIFFTDQGQTGMHDPTGRVYRLSVNGRLDCLLSNVPSPNGIVLTPDEKTLYVSATRANAVWRVPLMNDGGVSKVGVFCTMFGPGGPDGMCMDMRENLFVAHVGLGCVFVYSRRGEHTHTITSEAGERTTNVVLGSQINDQQVLYITEAHSGSVLSLPWNG
jgi:gluconolactonase